LPVLREQAEKFWLVRSVIEDEAGNPRLEWDNAAIMARAGRLRDEVWRELNLQPPDGPAASTEKP